MEGAIKIPMHPRFAPGKCRRNGFTLTELMVTVAVASILIAMAAPSFSGLIAQQKMKTAATDLYLSLMKARSEALKRNTNVTLSPTDEQWQSGWSIADPSNTSQKIDDHGPLKNTSITGPTGVTYRSSGRVLATDTTPTFLISSPAATTQICVMVDLSGRPYQKTTTTSSCS